MSTSNIKVNVDTDKYVPVANLFVKGWTLINILRFIHNIVGLAVFGLALWVFYKILTMPKTPNTGVNDPPPGDLYMNPNQLSNTNQSPNSNQSPNTNQDQKT